MRQSTIYLLRHGQTDWNAEKRLQGHADIPLNQTGISEAEKVAEEFAATSLKAIYSSSLQRAHQTATIINRSHGHLIETFDALKESTYGPLEGLAFSDYYNNFSDLPQEETLHFKLAPEAESYFETYVRARPVLDQLASRHLGDEILIVSHGALIRGVIAMILQIDVRLIKVQNMGCVILQGDGSNLTINGCQRITGVS